MVKLKCAIFFSLINLGFGYLVFANENIGYGIGLGYMYNGFGVNVNHHSENVVKYLAVGCPTLGSSSKDGFVYACGGGLGVVYSSIFSQNKNKHGIAFHHRCSGLIMNNFN